MLRQHLVRVGVLGQVGRFTPVEPVEFPRGTRVVCRTRRGLELGEVLTVTGQNAVGAADGDLLRRVGVQDDLLIARLERHKHEAYEACAERLAARGLPAVLMEVEHLFDGQSLYFYFLGDPTDELESLTEELAETYETQVQFRKFTDALTEGCGPSCGTEEAEGAGCGTGGCSTCAVLSACGKKSS